MVRLGKKYRCVNCGKEFTRKWDYTLHSRLLRMVMMSSKDDITEHVIKGGIYLLTHYEGTRLDDNTIASIQKCLTILSRQQDNVLAYILSRLLTNEIGEKNGTCIERC